MRSRSGRWGLAAAAPTSWLALWPQLRGRVGGHERPACLPAYSRCTAAPWPGAVVKRVPLPSLPPLLAGWLLAHPRTCSPSPLLAAVPATRCRAVGPGHRCGDGDGQEHRPDRGHRPPVLLLQARVVRPGGCQLSVCQLSPAPASVLFSRFAAGGGRLAGVAPRGETAGSRAAPLSRPPMLGCCLHKGGVLLC